MSAHPRYDPETEGLVYHVVPTCQAESVSDILSESESAASATTISSDQVHDYFVTHQGRQHPASGNAARWLPVDNTRRDVLQHVVSKYIYGHNYLDPVRRILGSGYEAGKQRNALEIGTRGGSWVQDMATEFPHVQFRSLDIAPLVPHAPRSNIVFEVYDIGEGLLIEDNSQDIVFINWGLKLVKDYKALLLEAHRVLRPGGFIHIHEYHAGLWDPEDDLNPARATNPIGCRTFDLAIAATRELGADPEGCTKLRQWLSPNSELWEHSKQPGGFEQIYQVVKLVPPYPHVACPCASHLDPRMIQLMQYFAVVCTRDSVGLLCDAGLEVEEAKLLAEAMVEELKDPERCPLSKWYAVCAMKRNAVE